MSAATRSWLAGISVILVSTLSACGVSPAAPGFTVERARPVAGADRASLPGQSTRRQSTPPQTIDRMGRGAIDRGFSQREGTVIRERIGGREHRDDRGRHRRDDRRRHRSGYFPGYGGYYGGYLYPETDYYGYYPSAELCPEGGFRNPSYDLARVAEENDVAFRLIGSATWRPKCVSGPDIVEENERAFRRIGSATWEPK